MLKHRNESFGQCFPLGISWNLRTFHEILLLFSEAITITDTVINAFFGFISAGHLLAESKNKYFGPNYLKKVKAYLKYSGPFDYQNEKF